MLVSISEALGIGKFLQSVLQVIWPPKIEGYIAERELIPDFEAALNGGWDIRDLLVYVKIANTARTSVMDWVAAIKFSDGSSHRFTLSKRDSSDWLTVLDGRRGSPLDTGTILEKNVTHEGWLWFRLAINMKEIESLRVLAVEPNKREHEIASDSVTL
jgi:hypothetical protein